MLTNSFKRKQYEFEQNASEIISISNLFVIILMAQVIPITFDKVSVIIRILLLFIFSSYPRSLWCNPPSKELAY